jgi:CubicO group peptidase (beta-lactamase class C family)
MLVEEGKLDLDADFTEYLPEFDTGGKVIPLRRLMDHTSGIRSYTEMPVFGDLAMKRLPRDTMVSLLEVEPLDFEPGGALIYNNSAYFLLGLIIEKVSGQPYGDFITERIFEPLGMNSSYYCSETAIRERRAHGYDGTPNGLIRKRYLDHTWPYAAGSLCSSAGDLVRWNQALHGEQVLSPASYQELVTPGTLADGTPIRYAKGLGVSGSGAHRMIAHGGGINGFTSDGRYYPRDDLVIVVLQNSTGPMGPSDLASTLARLILGPPPALEAVAFDGELGDFAGTYTGPARGRWLAMEVSAEDGQLVIRPQGMGEEMRPVHLGDLTWGEGSTRVIFRRVNGRVTELHLDQVSGHYVLKRIESEPS